MSDLSLETILEMFEAFSGTLRTKSQDRLYLAIAGANAGSAEALIKIARTWLAVCDDLTAAEFVLRSKAWIRSNSIWPTPSDIISMGAPDPRPIIEALIRLSRSVTPGGYLGEGGQIVSERTQWTNLVHSKFGDPPPKWIMALARAAGGYRGLKALPLASENAFRFDAALRRIEKAPTPGGSNRNLLPGEIAVGELMAPRGGDS